MQFLVTVTQGTGDVCSKGKKHNERGYAGMILHHIVDQKMPMSKSERQPFAQEPPWVPQVSPKGQNFGLNNFLILPSDDVYLCDFLVY